MGRPTRSKVLVAVMASLATCYGCDDSSSTSEPTLVTGATPVRGTERLAWAQVGNVSRLRFRAYVDNQPVDLPDATCDASTPADCRSPLPPLTAGIHSIALVNVLIVSGIESALTPSISVQKLPSISSLTASLPRTAARLGSVRLETELSIAGTPYSADVIATGVDGSAQLAALPDGRLVIGKADGHVRILRPGDARIDQEALNARESLSPSPIGGIAVASHPEFLRNHFVYLSFLAQESRSRVIFRVVRMREIGNTLGEPATVFEAPVAVLEPAGERTESEGASAGQTPRMAFGPDHLLYLSLPDGVEFQREPAASIPVASMLRLTDEGRLPPEGPLRGITSHPLGFTSHPDSGAMLGIFAGSAEDTIVRSLADGSVDQATRSSLLPMMRRLSGPNGDALRLRPDTPEYARFLTLKGRAEAATAWTARLRVPVVLESQLDRVGDVVAGSGETLFVVMESNGPRSRTDFNADAVVVRLTPIKASAAR